MLRLLRSEEVAERIDVIAKALRQLAADLTYLDDDRIFENIHVTLSSSGARPFLGCTPAEGRSHSRVLLDGVDDQALLLECRDGAVVADGNADIRHASHRPHRATARAELH